MIGFITITVKMMIFYAQFAGFNLYIYILYIIGYNFHNCQCNFLSIIRNMSTVPVTINQRMLLGPDIIACIVATFAEMVFPS